jgi:hypothetical protein
VRQGIDRFKALKPGDKLSQDEIPGLADSGWDPALDDM